METGMINATRFYYKEAIDLCKSDMACRLNEHSFRTTQLDLELQQDLECTHEGWVSAHNFLDSNFDKIDFMYSQYLLFDLRIDKRKLPAATFKAHLDRKIKAWIEEHGTERCPATIKKEIKEALKIEFLRRSIPTTKTIEVVVNLEERYVLVYSKAIQILESVIKRFKRTFVTNLIKDDTINYLEAPLAALVVAESNPLILGEQS